MTSAANSPAEWDRIWSREGRNTWRADALADVYDRIVELCPEGPAIDLGGGVGVLAERIGAEVWDQSQAAIDHARRAGLKAALVDLEDLSWNGGPEGTTIVGTEILEHLSARARDDLLVAVAGRAAFFSVPNNRLGPEVEAQHTIQWTAKEFLDLLRSHWTHARVEVIGGYLLGVCGPPAAKGFRLSVCTPARDEADDIERVLSTFRGVADDLVVGIDPRSSDRTEEIARQYADTVFEISDPTGGEVCEKGVHFANIRNQCIDRCSGDWVFMTEAHESLRAGADVLLQFAAAIPDHVGVIFVTRSGQGQEWLFPWLFRRHPGIRFERATHNYLEWPKGIDSRHLRHVKTLHERSRDNAQARDVQRRAQNRVHLHQDWVANENSNSLFYLGQEWRAYDPERAIRYFERFLATEKKKGGVRYQARLILAKLYARADRWDDARRTLIPATGDDWQRTEHWLWLGDVAFEHGRSDEALALYQLAASRWPSLPLSMFWFDVSSYTYLLAQRLAMAYAAVGDLDRALLWGDRVIETLPEDTPEAMKQEAIEIRDRITEASKNE